MMLSECFCLISQTRSGVTTVDTIWLEKGGGVSKLTLTMLGDDDEGNYSCRSNGFESDTVTLRVVSEELEEGKRFVKSNLFCDYVVGFIINFFSEVHFVKGFWLWNIKISTFHISRGGICINFVNIILHGNFSFL